MKPEITRLFHGTYAPSPNQPAQGIESTPFQGIFTTDADLFARITGEHQSYAARALRQRRQLLRTVSDEQLLTMYVHFHYRDTPVVSETFELPALSLGQSEPRSVRRHLQYVGEAAGMHSILVYTFANRFGRATVLECEIPPEPQAYERAYRSHLRNDLVTLMQK